MRTLRLWLVGLLAALSGALLIVPATAAAASGSLDTGFGIGGFATVPVGTTAGAAAVAVQPNGDIVTAGQGTVNGVENIVATRMTPDGKLDPTFGHGGVVTFTANGAAGTDSGAALALQPDGKIVIAGGARASTYGPIEFAAIRLNSDGSLDQGFGNHGFASATIGPYSIANAVAIQPNGDIVLGGGAAQGSSIYFAAARLMPNGTLDSTFGSHGITLLSSLPAGNAWGMVLQDDGLVLAGQEAQCSSCANGYMAARLTSNGQLDRSFANGGVFARALGSYSAGLAAATAANGDVLISGNALTSGYHVATIALTPSGTLDPSFGSGGISSFSGWGTNAMAVDSSGRIDLAGTGAAIVRLKPDGSIDTSFGSGGIGFYCNSLSCAANGVALQPGDGDIVIAGATAILGNQVMVARVTP